jgi:integrase
LQGDPDDLVFPMWHSAMLETLKGFARLDAKGEPITVHGFRSSFQDWAAESTLYPQIVVDMALGHAIGSKVEASYRRGDLYAQRMSLMADWAKYCTS